MEDTETTAAENALVQKFRVVRTQELEQLPLRPGYGTAGTPVLLRANYIAFTQLPKGPLYEYKIYYQPEATAKRVRRRLLQLLDEKTPEFAPYKRHIAHDGSEKLISTQMLYPSKGNPLEIRVKFFDEDEEYVDSDRSRTYTLSFSFTGELSQGEIDKCV